MNRWYRHLRIVAICLLLLGVAAGCSSSPYKSVNLDPMNLFAEKGKTAVNSSEASWQTRQYLRLSFLTDEYKKNPAKLISKLGEMSHQQPTPELRQAVAELALVQAGKVRRSDPQGAMMYYVMAAEQSYDFLFSDARGLSSSPLIPSYRLMGDIYNVSVARAIAMRSKVTDIWEPRNITFGGMTYHFTVDGASKGIWDPRIFDYIYNSYELRVSGIANEYLSKGAGAPLVGIVEKPTQKPGFGEFYPRRVACYPVTAFAQFGPVRQEAAGPARAVDIKFYDSLVTDSIEMNGKPIPLEADFTTPLGVQIRNVKPESLGLHNLFKSQDVNEVVGLGMLEPYRQDKIPVLMVHGLMSSPMTWVPMFNDLRGDPELRKHYQFWFFQYPTGLPIGYSTSILREKLNAIRAKYDPNGTNPNFNQMVLIGHSMGGLLSRGMIQDSGNTFWDYYFKEPLDSLQVDDATKKTLKSVFFFEHQPYIKRVIFIATPHRGSDMADAWYTRFAAGMVALPQNVTNTTENLVLRKSLTETAGANLTKRAPNSLILLSPSSSFIKATNQVPFYGGIPYHSIMGTRWPKTSGEGTSDGTVAYWSSHLDGAESELLVPSDHSAHAHPLAIAEVKRILKEHLAKIQQQTTAAAKE
jgi:pimeloyl-ACP methyl ester carboxylesterase